MFVCLFCFDQHATFTNAESHREAAAWIDARFRQVFTVTLSILLVLLLPLGALSNVVIAEVFIFRKALHFSSSRLHSVSSALAVGFVRIDSNKVAEIGVLLFPS